MPQHSNFYNGILGWWGALVMKCMMGRRDGESRNGKIFVGKVAEKLNFYF